MTRRHTLRPAFGGAQAFTGTLWHCAAPARPVAAVHGPYGPLAEPDRNGVALPAGFTSRVVARSLEAVGGGRWHPAPDGGACFADGDGWIYVSNSEMPLSGGTSAIRFSGDGDVKAVYPILTGSNLNCSGTATGWHTWLSCEEIFRGKVYETDPFGDRAARPRTAMGRFRHCAAACDEDHRAIYLTESESDGCLYRYVPRVWGDLSSGRLDVLCRDDTGLNWCPVPDPEPGTLDVQTRYQCDTAVRFGTATGCHYIDGTCFLTAGDAIWAYDVAGNRLTELDPGADGSHPDRVGGDVYVVEDGDSMEINVVADGIAAPLLRVDGHDGSRITGPAFSPDGTRLYFSSQRGPSGDTTGAGGVTFEVTGPFRR